MDRSRLEIKLGVWLDARRALFLAETQTLVAADLHLGYAWAHRHSGQMLPITAGEDSLTRLLALVESYAPREMVLLGDIVHRAIAVEALRVELCAVINTLNDRLHLILVTGNHDRHLRRLLDECGLKAPLTMEHRSGNHWLVHGDARGDVTVRRAKIGARGCVVIGHEHPAITISDGVASRAKCPCFLISEEVIVLPAFSLWAAGTNVRSHALSSPWTMGVSFADAVAVAGGKLLPLRI